MSVYRGTLRWLDASRSVDEQFDRGYAVVPNAWPELPDPEQEQARTSEKQKEEGEDQLHRPGPQPAIAQAEKASTTAAAPSIVPAIRRA